MSPRRPAVSPHGLLAICILCWSGALVATHVPPRGLPKVRADFALHAAGYLALTAVFWLTLRAHGLGRGRRIGWVLAAMIPYAALDELTQPLFARSASLADWAADLLGAVAALVLLEAGQSLLRRRSRQEDPA